MREGGLRGGEGGAPLGGRAAGRGDFSAPARGSEKEEDLRGEGGAAPLERDGVGRVRRAQKGWGGRGERRPCQKYRRQAGGPAWQGEEGAGKGGWRVWGAWDRGRRTGARERGEKQKRKGKGAQKESRSGRCPETGSLVGPILLAGVCPDGVYWSSSPSPSKRSMGDSALNLLTAAVALLMGCRVPGPATQPPTQAIPSIR